MRYKVGDRVRIKSLDWYNKNKTSEGCLVCGSSHINPEMICMLGKIATISSVEGNHYRIKEYGWNWTDEMIEGLVEDVNVSEFKHTQDEITKMLLQGALNIPEGYYLRDQDGNIINAKYVTLEKKKTEYPKTYEECCYVLGFENTELVFEDDYRDINPPKEQWKRLGLMNQLNKLLICRDAYWKIAGEEMGLGKPWEPDWENSEERRYSIVNIEGDINLPEKTLTKWILKVTNKILVFPTEEMRDAFYENFKNLIEQCKELL